MCWPYSLMDKTYLESPWPGFGMRTICVVAGRRFASATGIVRPVLESRPIANVFDLANFIVSESSRIIAFRCSNIFQLYGGAWHIPALLTGAPNSQSPRALTCAGFLYPPPCYSAWMRVPEHPIQGKIVTVKSTAPHDVQRELLADIDRQLAAIEAARLESKISKDKI